MTNAARPDCIRKAFSPPWRSDLTDKESLISLASGMVKAFFSTGKEGVQYTIASILRGAGGRMEGELVFGMQDINDDGVLESYGALWRTITMTPGFVGAIQFMDGVLDDDHPIFPGQKAIMLIMEDADGWCRTRIQPFTKGTDGRLCPLAEPYERDGDRQDTCGVTLGR